MSELVLEKKELPDGWIDVMLEDIVYFQEGPGLRKYQYGDNKGIPFLNIRTFENGKINKEKCNFIKKEEFENKYERFLLDEEDLVVSSSGTIGKSVTIKKEDLPIMLNTSVIRFRSKNENILLQSYLKCYLRSQHFLKQINLEKTGSTISNYGPTHLKKVHIIFPSIQEQKRIVTKIDELFSKLEHTKTSLNNVKLYIQQYKKTLLKSAFEGTLTKEWRGKNNPINSEFLLNESILNKKKQNSKFQIFEIDKTPQTFLPKEWMWTCLGNFAICTRGRFSIRPRNDPRYYNGNYPFIQIGDLQSNGGLINFHKQTLNDKGLKVSKKFKKNTVVIAIVGATIGNTGILGYDMCFPDSLIGINCDSVMSNYFIEYYLRSIKEEIKNISYSSGGQPNINSDTINHIIIPLPSIDEQTQIVNILDTSITTLDFITNDLFKLEKKINTLSLLILKQAFEGKLVPQDPNDEPAEILLQKIKQEKEQLIQKQKPSRSTKNVK